MRVIYDFGDWKYCRVHVAALGDAAGTLLKSLFIDSDLASTKPPRAILGTSFSDYTASMFDSDVGLFVLLISAEDPTAVPELQRLLDSYGESPFVDDRYTFDQIRLAMIVPSVSGDVPHTFEQSLFRHHFAVLNNAYSQPVIHAERALMTGLVNVAWRNTVVGLGLLDFRILLSRRGGTSISARSGGLDEMNAFGLEMTQAEGDAQSLSACLALVYGVGVTMDNLSATNEVIAACISDEMDSRLAVWECFDTGDLLQGFPIALYFYWIKRQR